MLRVRQEYIGKVMALHTRYPGHKNETKIVPGSPFTRVKGIIERVFERCNSTACLPQGGLPMVAFWKADSNPQPLSLSQAQQPVTAGSSAPCTLTHGCMVSAARLLSRIHYPRGGSALYPGPGILHITALGP